MLILLDPDHTLGTPALEQSKVLLQHLMEDLEAPACSDTLIFPNKFPKFLASIGTEPKHQYLTDDVFTICSNFT